MFFLPPKAKYRKNMVQKIIRSLEKNNGKAGIFTANQEAAITEEDDLFKDLQNEINALRNLQPDLVPEDFNATLLTDVDPEVSAVQPLLTDSEILAEFFKTGNISDGDDEVMYVSDGLEEEPMKFSGKSDLLLALEVLQKFSLFSTNGEAL